MRLSRMLRGVEEQRTLDGPVLRSGEARRLGRFTGALQEIYKQPANLVRRDRSVADPRPAGPAATRSWTKAKRA